MKLKTPWKPSIYLANRQAMTQTAPLFKLHKSPDTLPLNRYMDLLFDEDIFAIIVEGDPNTIPENALREAAAQIHAEVAKLDNSNDSNELLEAFKDFNSTQAQMILVESAISDIRRLFETEETLLQLPDDAQIRYEFAEFKKQMLPGCITMLQELIPSAQSITVEDTYETAMPKLKKIQTASKKLVVQLNIKSQQISEAENRNERLKPTRMKFLQALSALSKAGGYSIRPADITVTQFYIELNTLYKQALQRHQNQRERSK